MYATIPVETESKSLQIGIGFASHQDAIWAAVRATAMARTGLHGTSPDLVLLVTAGVPAQDVVPLIRGVLGPVGVAGGATSAILTHNGAVTAGALVVCLTNGEGAVSGVAAAGGRDLTEAGQGAARLEPQEHHRVEWADSAERDRGGRRDLVEPGGVDIVDAIRHESDRRDVRRGRRRDRG